MALTVVATDRGLVRALQAMTRQLRDMTPVYQEIGAKLEENVDLRFDLKEDPNGTPWKPWAPSTAAARAREGRGTLLEYTGRMRASLTHRANRLGAEVGFGVPYAKYHELTRPMLSVGGQLSASDKRDVLTVATRAFARALALQRP